MKSRGTRPRRLPRPAGHTQRTHPVSGRRAHGHRRAHDEHGPFQKRAWQTATQRMDQRAPQHRLCQTVGKPDRLHRADMTGYGHGEVQPRRGKQGERHSEPRVIAFGENAVDNLTAAVSEKKQEEIIPAAARVVWSDETISTRQALKLSRPI